MLDPAGDETVRASAGHRQKGKEKEAVCLDVCRSPAGVPTAYRFPKRSVTLTSLKGIDRPGVSLDGRFSAISVRGVRGRIGGRFRIDRHACSG